VNNKPEMLCVGHDPVLNRTRRLVLERCFAVTLAESVNQAMSLLTARRFALMLLCYSLADEECSALVEFVHGRAAATKILALGQGRDRLLGFREADEEFQPRGPEELVMKAAAMAGIGPEEAEDCVADKRARKSA
jgi:hypothetical protein